MKLCLQKKYMLLIRDTAYIRSQVMSALVMGEAILPSVYSRGSDRTRFPARYKLSRKCHCCCRGYILILVIIRLVGGCCNGRGLHRGRNHVRSSRGCCHDSPGPNSATACVHAYLVACGRRLNRRCDHFRALVESSTLSTRTPPYPLLDGRYCSSRVRTVPPQD